MANESRRGQRCRESCWWFWRAAANWRSVSWRWRDGGCELGAFGATFGVPVGRDRGVEPGELIGEPVVGEAERVDAVGEGLVGADAGEGDVGPVGVEPIERRGDRIAPPILDPLERVVGGLVCFEAADAMFGGGDCAGGFDDGGAIGVEVCFELMAAGPPGTSDGGERAEALQLDGRIVESVLGDGELLASDGQRPAGVDQLGDAAGRLAVEHGLVAGDHRS